MFNREKLEGTEIRERMIEDDDWEELVPEAVVDIITEIDGIERIQRISDTDGAVDRRPHRDDDADPE
ncbi:MAG TPA: nicotinate-nucleotide adenylyltransferase, partial [Halococcus sp.]|nr:nicotinate-nucleotide adenylyltransferase [Halococcus sp.]